jgi:hypothetical protein
MRDLLHLVSQPLTTVHCALEGSLSRHEGERAEHVVVALEQTDRAIEAVRLMREYLEAEQNHSFREAIPIAPEVDSVLQQLAVVAEVRGVHLFTYGDSKATITLGSPWLQRALLYFVADLVENESPGRAVIIVLEDGPCRSVLSGHSIATDFAPEGSTGSPGVAATLRLARIAIAKRALESAGASVQLHSEPKPGFTIQIDRSGGERCA